MCGPRVRMLRQRGVFAARTPPTVAAFSNDQSASEPEMTQVRPAGGREVSVRSRSTPNVTFRHILWWATAYPPVVGPCRCGVGRPLFACARRGRGVPGPADLPDRAPRSHGIAAHDQDLHPGRAQGRLATMRLNE